MIGFCISSIFIQVPPFSREAAYAQPGAQSDYVFITEWRHEAGGNTYEVGIAVDSSASRDAVYVADNSHHRILKFSKNGTFLHQWGKMGAGNGEFQWPTDVAVDSGGNVYVTEYQGERVQKFSSNGTYLGQLDLVFDGIAHTGQQGITLDPSNDEIYVADTAYNQIARYSQQGDLLGVIGSSGPDEGELAYPNDVAIDSSGNVIVADSYNNRIQKFSKDGTFLVQWNSFGPESAEIYNPSSVVIDAADGVYVSVAGSIQKFSGNGTYLGSALSEDPLRPYQRDALDLAIDLGSGDIFSVSNIQNANVVEKFSVVNASASIDNYALAERRWPEAPGDDIRASVGSILIDPLSGDVYVADTVLHRILKYSSNGTLLAKWGMPGSGDGELLSPVDLALDSDGNVYVAESDNKRVQKFSSEGRPIAKFGGGPFEESFMKGRLAYPNSIAINSHGEVLVSDMGNQRISFFESDGTHIRDWNASIPATDDPLEGFSATGFYEASGINVDSQDNIYVIDTLNFSEPPYSNYRIAKFSPAGDMLLASWNLAGSSDTPASHITSLFVDRNDDSVFAADYESNSVFKFTSNGTLLNRLGSSGYDSGSFAGVGPVAVSQEGLVYIGDSRRVQVFAPSDSEYASDRAPSIVVPKTVVFNATDLDVTALNVTYDVQVNDDLDPAGSVLLDCAPPSGSTFFVGLNTTVTCYATDLSGKTATKLFSVFVRPPAQEQEVLPPAYENYSFIAKWGARTDNAYLYAGKVATDVDDNLYVLSSTVMGPLVQKYNSTGFPVLSLVEYGTEEGQVYYPSAIALDRDGDSLYVADSDEGKVAKYSAVNGHFIAEWGNRVAGDNASDRSIVLSQIGGLAVDSGGNIYVSDSGNLRIVKFSEGTQFLLAWGSEGAGEGQFSYPQEVVVDSKDNVYVRDIDGRIQKFSSEGVFISQWSVPGGDAGQSRGLAVDQQDNIYVLGSYGQNATIFSSEGLQISRINLTRGDPSLYDPTDIAINTHGNIYTSISNGGVNKFDSAGKYSDTVMFTPDSIGNFRSAFGILYDNLHDRVYVLDNADNRVQVFASDGTFVSQWAVGGPTFFETSEPRDFALDSSGDVYVIAERLLKYSGQQGKQLAAFGSQGNDEGEFGTLAAISIDGKGTIYIADSGNYRIHKLSPDGEYLMHWKIGDSGEQSGQTRSPEDMAIDSSGNLYVLMSFADTIEKFSSTGEPIANMTIPRAGQYPASTPNHAFRIAFDEKDNLYVGYFDGVIRKFSGNGTFLVQVSSSGQADGQVFFPTGIAVENSTGRVFVSDGGNTRVQIFRHDGTQVIPEFSGLYVSLLLAGAIGASTFAAQRLRKKADR